MKLGKINNELFRGLLHNLEANKRALKKELQSRLPFDLWKKFEEFMILLYLILWNS